MTPVRATEQEYELALLQSNQNFALRGRLRRRPQEKGMLSLLCNNTNGPKL
jgi:hypothetical protein